MKKNISHLFFKQQQQLQIFIYVLVGVLLVYRGVYTAPDSGAFLRMEFNRSPLYCSFLKLFTFTFGEFYQYPLLITQYLLLVFSSKFLLNTLNKEMRFNKSTILLTQIFILIPCLYLHHTSRAVLSESIAYPFLLIIISFSLKAFYYINLRPLFYAVPFLSLLLLTRGQFLILLPLFFFLTVYISFKNKKIKKGLSLVGILILIPVFNGLNKNEVCINALPDAKSIAAELEALILHPNQLLEISKNARVFIEKEHSYFSIAKKYHAKWLEN